MITFDFAGEKPTFAVRRNSDQDAQEADTERHILNLVQRPIMLLCLNPKRTLFSGAA